MASYMKAQSHAKDLTVLQDELTDYIRTDRSAEQHQLLQCCYIPAVHWLSCSIKHSYLLLIKPSFAIAVIYVWHA